jgi:undecaprenyl diphosphate synthase
MDGNGRWALARGLARTEGHIAGEESLFSVVDAAIEDGVGWLSVYAFSTENWRRSPDEVAFLMNFNQDLLSRRRDELHRRGVRIRFSGRRGFPVPDHVQDAMNQAEELTRNNTGLNLVVAFNYGSQAEIVDAVRKVVAAGIAPNDIDEAALAQHFYVPDMPAVDLVIRTSGEVRTSNFLLWQAAYAEYLFVDTLWPDFDGNAFRSALAQYAERHRRFGA